MSNIGLNNGIRFVGLVLLQVVILNHINLFEFLNPLVYIVWVFLFPFKKNRSTLLILAFLLGLSIDFFSNSGGINASATLFIAYIRLFLLKVILKKTTFDFPLFKLNAIPFYKMLLFITILTVIHHLIVFSLAYFSFNALKTIIYNTFLTSLFTVILSVLGIVLFVKRK